MLFIQESVTYKLGLLTCQRGLSLHFISQRTLKLWGKGGSQQEGVVCIKQPASDFSRSTRPYMVKVKMEDESEGLAGSHSQLESDELILPKCIY